MRRELLFGRLLLLYQIPKTGSQTVEATLRQCALPHGIHRFHFLGSYMADRVREAINQETSSRAWKQNAQAQLRQAAELSRVIRWRKFLRWGGIPVPKLEVITGVRELIGLALSSIFQNQDCFRGDNDDLTLETCRELLLRPRMFIPLDHWFDWELKAHLGVDVYASPFCHERGYALYENRLARVLLYRIEALDRLPVMLKEFLGCDAPAMVHCNVGRAKSYSQSYALAQERLRLPPDFVAARYRTRVMQHFYSATERAALERKWSEQTTELPLGRAGPGTHSLGAVDAEPAGRLGQSPGVST